MEHYRRKYAKVKGTMKLEHDPGNEIFVDFADKKLQIIDKETGGLIPVGREGLEYFRLGNGRIGKEQEADFHLCPVVLK